jgi:hypothetical protein
MNVLNSIKGSIVAPLLNLIKPPYTLKKLLDVIAWCVVLTFFVPLSILIVIIIWSFAKVFIICSSLVALLLWSLKRVSDNW